MLKKKKSISGKNFINISKIFCIIYSFDRQMYISNGNMRLNIDKNLSNLSINLLRVLFNGT